MTVEVVETADAWGYFLAGLLMGGGTVLGGLAVLGVAAVARWAR